MNRNVIIVVTLDTKGEEASYLRDIMNRKGISSRVIDVGVLGKPSFQPDITREAVASRLSLTMEEIRSWNDEERAVKAMSDGASRIIQELHEQGAISGLIALGGSMGTSIALPIMKMLPMGIPKLMVSTVAFTPFIRPEFVSKDLILMQSVADMWGLNRITREMLEIASLMIAGAADRKESKTVDKPLIAISSLGGAACRFVFDVKPLLEQKGFEVAVFHATGMQGKAMEELIGEGMIDGVLDLCPYEIINELCGGSCSAGPLRMEAAGRRGIPQVIGASALGFFDWAGPPETFPEKYRGRIWNKHNDLSWEIKASRDEMIQVAKIMASKLNKSAGPVAVLIPGGGFSERDKPGAVFYDPGNNKAFMDTLRTHIKPGIEYVELSCHANDPEYSQMAVKLLLEMLNR